MEDIEKQMTGESTNQRMARICKEAMESINPDLKFTTECQEDFPGERLPTLDFQMWLTEDNKIKHTYFQKHMKTPYVIMERSGTSYHQKFQILSNELVRRLSNIDISLPLEERIETTEQYTKELKTSGYSVKQSREIVCSGIRGWKAKHKKRKDNNIPFYRLAETTVELRMRKELLEKETWYKENEGEKEKEDSIKKDNKPQSKPVSWKRTSKRLKRLGDREGVKSVIFIPHTRDSKLATLLRERESKLVETTGDRVKIVERAGRKIEDILTNKDPWKTRDCQRPNCFVCMTKVNTGQGKNRDCTRRNITYTHSEVSYL